MQDFLIGTFKITLACFFVGVILTFLGVTPEKLIAVFGFTPETFQTWLYALVAWVMPRLYLGAIVVIPAWLLIFTLMPRGRQ
jgi:hypothetical protein